jgi:hypothetical protein
MIRWVLRIFRKDQKPVFWHDDERASELAWDLAEFMRPGRKGSTESPRRP